MRRVRIRLVWKLSAIVLLAVVSGFGLYGAMTAQRQASALASAREDSMVAVARSVTANLRNAMVSGNPMLVRTSLQEAATTLGPSTVRIFDVSGRAAFEPRLPPEPGFTPPPLVAQALLGRPGGTHGVVLLKNEVRCQRCHTDGENRGVVTARIKHSVTPAEALASSAQLTFIQLMSARRMDQAETYLHELREQAPGVRAAAVIGRDGALSAGQSTATATAAANRAITTGERVIESSGTVTSVAIPLKWEKRCAGCHQADPAIRGAIAVELDSSGSEGRNEVVSAAVGVSMRNVMLSGLGRIAADTLDRLERTGHYSTLSVHDRFGRIYRDTTAHAATASSKLAMQALKTGQGFFHARVEDAASPQYEYVEPLPNEARCQRCHSADHNMRGVVQITVDATRDQQELASVRQAGWFATGGAVFLVLLSIYLGLRLTVLSPVQALGDAADRVRAGDFRTEVDLGGNDEIARLGERFNQMVKELRKKRELSKMVSGAARQRIHSVTGEQMRIGKLIDVAILFSDVRGFTRYSERREPGEVVEVLNRLLGEQSRIVTAHGGDVDKFVGDEIMAIFTGDDRANRAVSCAIAMATAVAQMTNVDSLRVGVGVAMGTVVQGGVGDDLRMDFTVIGDTVNLAARLCSMASPDEVVVEEVAAGAAKLPKVVFEPGVPVAIDGREESVRIFRHKILTS